MNFVRRAGITLTLVFVLTVAIRAARPAIMQHTGAERILHIPARLPAPVDRRTRRAPSPRWSIALPDAGIESLPVDIVADANTIIMTTPLGNVVALTLERGTVVWTRSTSHLGFRPRALATMDRNRIVVTGDAGDPVAVLSVQTGKTLATYNAGTSALVQSVCRMAGGLALVTLDDLPVRVLDGNGVLRVGVALPWPQLQTSHPLQRQLAAASSPDHDTCVLALMQGPGFSVFDSAMSVRLATYVEPVHVPDVQVLISATERRRVIEAHLLQSVVASSEITAARGRLFVAFEGSSPVAGHVLDEYDLRTGAYLHSYTFGESIRRITSTDAFLLIATYVHGIPTIRAFAMEAL